MEVENHEDNDPVPPPELTEPEPEPVNIELPLLDPAQWWLIGAAVALIAWAWKFRPRAGG
jgi:hypothetical protein